MIIRPDNSRFVVEHVTAPAATETSYEQTLEQLDHALFAFREAYKDADDDSLPVVHTYRKNDKIITVYSIHGGAIAVQIEDPSSRSVYSYDKREDKAVIFASSDQSENDSLLTYRLIPNEQNIGHVVSMCDYIAYTQNS